MISMQGVPSSLILRNASWVRQQAQSFMRRVPANVEKADLIQVGLIAVAQSALAFKWDGDSESNDAKQAFERYARMRVKGAMLDELRQMDQLGRAERRKVKVIQVATERWVARHGRQPTAAEMGKACGMTVQEVFDLELAARSAQTSSLSDDPESEDGPSAREPATEQDEVEARVDTGMLLRRLEPFFAALPERERQVIDACLGIGMTPVELANSMQVSPSRVKQLFKSICEQIGIHLGHAGHRSTDRVAIGTAAKFDDLISQREAELAQHSSKHAWGELVQDALAQSLDVAGTGGENTERLSIASTTRWG